MQKSPELERLKSATFCTAVYWHTKCTASHTFAAALPRVLLSARGRLPGPWRRAQQCRAIRMGKEPDVVFEGLRSSSSILAPVDPMLARALAQLPREARAGQERTRECRQEPTGGECHPANLERPDPTPTHAKVPRLLRQAHEVGNDD